MDEPQDGQEPYEQWLWSSNHSDLSDPDFLQVVSPEDVDAAEEQSSMLLDRIARLNAENTRLRHRVEVEAALAARPNNGLAARQSKHLQATERGRSARAAFLALKRAAIAVQACVRARNARAICKASLAAVVVLQSHQRSCRARQVLETERNRQAAAAIQSAVRRYLVVFVRAPRPSKTALRAQLMASHQREQAAVEKLVKRLVTVHASLREERQRATDSHQQLEEERQRAAEYRETLPAVLEDLEAKLEEERRRSADGSRQLEEARRRVAEYDEAQPALIEEVREEERQRAEVELGTVEGRVFTLAGRVEALQREVELGAATAAAALRRAEQAEADARRLAEENAALLRQKAELEDTASSLLADKLQLLEELGGDFAPQATPPAHYPPLWSDPHPPTSAISA